MPAPNRELMITPERMIVSTEACLPLMMIRMIANPNRLPKKAERVMTYGLVIIKRSEDRVMPAPAPRNTIPNEAPKAAALDIPSV